MEVVTQNVGRGINTDYDSPEGQIDFRGRAADRKSELSSGVKAVAGRFLEPSNPKNQVSKSFKRGPVDETPPLEGSNDGLCTSPGGPEARDQ